MNVKKNIDKGNHLEDAVHFIEKTILSSNPSLAKNDFTIETKKIIIVNGVKHEIDVYVEINLGHGYKTIFIFECKNWKKPVGKNEIIDFSEKIKVTTAQKGYFVSNSYSKYAINQSKLDNRLELLNISNSDKNFLTFPKFHVIEREVSQTVVNISFVPRKPLVGRYKTIVEDINIHQSIVTLNGKQIDFDLFANTESAKIINLKLKNGKTEKLPPGIHQLEYNSNIEFKNGDLIINGEEIEKVIFNIKFPLCVSKPKIIYKFDVKSKGRVIAYKDKLISGNRIELKLIELEKHQKL